MATLCRSIVQDRPRYYISETTCKFLHLFNFIQAKYFSPYFLHIYWALIIQIPGSQQNFTKSFSARPTFTQPIKKKKKNSVAKVDIKEREMKKEIREVNSGKWGSQWGSLGVNSEWERKLMENYEQRSSFNFLTFQ